MKWLKDAGDDLNSVEDYIKQQDKPQTAVKIIIKIINTVESLADHPATGRVGRVEGTRELIISGLPYIVPYRIRGNTVEILRVLHTSRLWPERFK